MKRMILVAVTAAGLAGFSATTADYVQDGLIAHWDAIDNAGTGTHDSGATTWKNLVAGGMDLTLDTAVWADGNALRNTTGRAAHGSAVLDYSASEFVIEHEDTSTTESNYVFANGGSKYCILTSGYVQFTNTWKMTAFTYKTGGFHSLSWSTDDRNYLDGVEQRNISHPYGFGANALKYIYMGDNGGGERIFKGKYHAIRLYSRALTPDEANRNAVVDRIRFKGVYDDGYRASPVDGSIQKAFSVSNAAGGTVTVDGETLQADFEEWTEFYAERTHTIRATPADGYIFNGWSGDTGHITSGTLLSREITVTSALAVKLVPIFVAVPAPSNAEPVVTINVPPATTNVLDDWLEANPDVSIGATGTIVKEGGGTLQVTNGIISAFAGEIVVNAGRWLADTREGLGAQTGGDVWVNSGATLHLRATEPSEVSSQTLKRKVYIKGTGWDGNGALFASNIKGYNANTQFNYMWPKYVTLLGDAKWGINSHVNLNGLYVDMNRFTLTIRPDCDWTYFQGGGWSNGNITVTGTTVLMQGAKIIGGEENILRFEPSSGYCTYGNTPNENDGNALWKMELASGASIYARGVNSGWSGPVTLEGNTKVTSQNVWTSMTFWGPISGPGNIGKTSNAGSGWNYTSRGVTIRLANSANSFEGGIWLKYNILEADTDGAIPPDGGAVNSFNSTINLKAAKEYHLPDLVLSGTGSVYSVAGTTGSFKAAEKNGNELITWNTKVGAKSFALNGGTLSFGSVPVSNGAVDVDFGRFSSTDGATLDLAGNSWTCTNLTGAAALVDGTFALDGPWTLDAAAAGTLGGGTAVVSFGPNAELTLANPETLDHSAVYTIATSSSAFAEAVPLSETTKQNTRWHVRLSADGKSQELFYASGMTVILR